MFYMNLLNCLFNKDRDNVAYVTGVMEPGAGGKDKESA